jgi:MFS transporter, DHA1 family, tetracycline resistance protein
MTVHTTKGSLTVIFLTVFIDLLGFGMVLPLLPIYADHFVDDPSGWKLGALMGSFSVMQLFFSPLWGRLSDRIGRRPVLMIGLGGSVAFYSLFGWASVEQSYALLLLSRIGAGIAGATISTAQAYIADVTTLQQRPRGMALIGMAFGLGFTFGPLFGFLAVPYEGAPPGPWPGYAAAILSAVALALAYFLLPESLRPGSETAHRKLFDAAGFRRALATPSIGLLLLAIFVCVFSFANFETTLSLLIKGGEHATATELNAGPEAASEARRPFDFSWGEVCLTYAYIGFTLAVVQGGFVRRLADRAPEGVLAAFGAAVEMIGFALMVLAVSRGSVSLLLAALAVVVTGFAFMQPMLNSLLSRRSDPHQQGVILGVGQSVNALARIAGSVVGIPLLRLGLTTPYYTAAGLMALGLVLVIFAARGGGDFPAQEPSAPST